MSAIFLYNIESFGKGVFAKFAASVRITAEGTVKWHFQNNHNSLSVTLVQPFMCRRFGMESADFNTLSLYHADIFFYVFAVMGNIAMGKSVLTAEKIRLVINAEFTVAHGEIHKRRRLSDCLQNIFSVGKSYGEFIQMRLKRP